MDGNTHNSTVNLDLPDATWAFIDKEVANGAAASREEYIARLMQNAHERREQEERLEAELVKGLDSPAEEVTDEAFARDREEFERRLAEQRNT